MSSSRKKTVKGYSTKPVVETALLVGAESHDRGYGLPIESSINELANLTASAGAKVVGRVVQKLSSISPTHYLGEGKIKFVAELRSSTPYSMVVFDDELTPRQQRNIEDALELKVIDRTSLILEILAKRARTKEGQLQVELAQLKYLLPRLTGQWSHLERLGGGIGTRGPGESQLETDHRIIKDRIKRLEKRLDEVRRHRALYQSQRLKASIPVVALVGYTNSGKSTLLNNLTGASVTVTNNLFSTLDPVTRRIRLPNGVVCLLTDTVGFISKLPPSVVAAFRATLDELHNAQLLLHIVDISGREAGYHYQTVEEILRELSLERKRKLTVVNKLDLVVSTERDLEDIYSQSKSFGLPFEISEDLIYVSAVKGWGLSLLLDRVSHCLPESNSENRQTAYYKQLSET